jgi:hypothetical protein
MITALRTCVSFVVDKRKRTNVPNVLNPLTTKVTLLKVRIRVSTLGDYAQVPCL